jgi:hypothetical protein
MSLDLYVGTLTRYLSGDWVTLVAPAPPGGEPEVEHHPTPDDAVTDPAFVRDVVLDWREALGHGLKQHGVVLDWDEGDSVPYRAERLPDGGYGALQLLAAYDDRPDLSAPDDDPRRWRDSSAVRAVSGSDAHTRYPALVKGARWWLPAAFPFGFDAPSPSGAHVRMASVDSLAEQLAELDARTLQVGDEAELDVPGTGAPFEELARHALATFRRLVGAAVDARLPLLLDVDGDV